MDQVLTGVVEAAVHGDHSGVLAFVDHAELTLADEGLGTIDGHRLGLQWLTGAATFRCQRGNIEAKREQASKRKSDTHGAAPEILWCAA